MPAPSTIEATTSCGRANRAAPRVILGVLLAALLTTSACANIDGDAAAVAPTTGDALTTTTAPAGSSAAPTTSASVEEAGIPQSGHTDGEPEADPEAGVEASSRPDWLGNRPLPTLPDGGVVPQTTPEELIDRRLPTIDTLPPPTDGFTATIAPLEGEPLERSTWNEGCPVSPEELSYVTVSFWGFDERAHQGELIVNASVAVDVTSVFEALFEARFPIEEMRIVTQADLDALPTGDGNNTSSFVCRAVTGGSRFSEHAFGLAIDLNPFHNPYVKGDLVLPELATAYGDRGTFLPGMIVEGDPAVTAFARIGWGWGGRWSSLKDYQHFALNDR